MKELKRLKPYLMGAICIVLGFSNHAYAVDEDLLLATQNMLANGQSVDALELLRKRLGNPVTSPCYTHLTF